MNEIPPKQIESEESIQVLKSLKQSAEYKLEGFRFRVWIIIIAFHLGGGLGYVAYSLTHANPKPEPNTVIAYILLGSISGAFIYFFITFGFRSIGRDNLTRINYRLAQLGADELKDKIEVDFFTKLVQINFKYIDQYYLQTQEQANKSFRLASFASISGFAIILIGIVMMFTSEVDAAKVTTAAGLISQFISAIFFYLYNRTILKMSQYHQKLVLTQNISLALKMTETMDAETKTKSLGLIIDRLTLDINKYLTDFKE
jgi:hypothetical protein